MCIATINNDDYFYDIGVEYTSNMEVENDLVEYSPYFVEKFSEPSEIELNLLLYNPSTMEAMTIDQYNMDEIYDWLITDTFVPFISDDDKEIIYYFKVTKVSKVLTFDKRGYLRVSFKPYSSYCYKRVVYESSGGSLQIYNYSKLVYKPIMEVTNLGGSSGVIKINNMEITGLGSNETVKIDNLTKLVLDGQNKNKFSCCNGKWIELSPRTNNSISISGSCRVKIICEFPIFY